MAGYIWAFGGIADGKHQRYFDVFSQLMPFLATTFTKWTSTQCSGQSTTRVCSMPVLTTDQGSFQKFRKKKYFKKFHFEKPQKSLVVQTSSILAVITRIQRIQMSQLRKITPTWIPLKSGPGMVLASTLSPPKPPSHGLNRTTMKERWKIASKVFLKHFFTKKTGLVTNSVHYADCFNYTDPEGPEGSADVLEFDF